MTTNKLKTQIKAFIVLEILLKPLTEMILYTVTPIYEICYVLSPGEIT